MRLIDGDTLLKNIRRAVYPSDMTTTIAVGICESHVKDMPTIDAVPVVHGHWIIYPDVCVCSECNEQSPGIFKYCPNCGALMDMEAKEGWE